MELKAHLQEFGALSQYLAPEKSDIFRRINFEYLLQLNNRSVEEMQKVLWEGICTNLNSRQNGVENMVRNGKMSYESLQTVVDLSFFLPKMNAATALETMAPVQLISEQIKDDQDVSLSLSNVAVSEELYLQALYDLREALFCEKEQSKWLLIAAFKQLHKAVRLHPGNYHAQFNYAYMCSFFFRKSEKAEEHFELCIKHSFEQDIVITVFALRHLAETRREMEKFEAAVEASNEAFMLDRGKTLQIQFDLARYLTLANQHEKAFKNLEDLLADHSEYYWQAIAEPDFSQNQEIVVLLNALSRAYLDVDNSGGSDDDFPIDDASLADLLDENERINKERRDAEQQLADLFKKELENRAKSGNKPRTATPPPTQIKPNKSAEPENRAKPTETGTTDSPKTPRIVNEFRPIVVRANPEQLKKARKNNGAGKLKNEPVNGSGESQSVEKDAPDLENPPFSSNAATVFTEPESPVEPDALFDDNSSEINNLLNQIREQYLENKNRSLAEKAAPLPPKPATAKTPEPKPAQESAAQSEPEQDAQVDPETDDLTTHKKQITEDLSDIISEINDSAATNAAVLDEPEQVDQPEHSEATSETPEIDDVEQTGNISAETGNTDVAEEAEDATAIFTDPLDDIILEVESLLSKRKESEAAEESTAKNDETGDVFSDSPIEATPKNALIDQIESQNSESDAKLPEPESLPDSSPEIANLLRNIGKNIDEKKTDNLADDLFPETELPENPLIKSIRQRTDTEENAPEFSKNLTDTPESDLIDKVDSHSADADESGFSELANEPNSDLLSKIAAATEQSSNKADEQATPQNTQMSDLLLRIEQNAATSEAETPFATQKEQPQPPPKTQPVNNDNSSDKPEATTTIDDDAAEIRHELELALQRCEELDSLFTRRDKDKTQIKIYDISENAIKSLRKLGDMERRKVVKTTKTRMRQQVEAFQERHKIIAKFKRN